MKNMGYNDPVPKGTHEDHQDILQRYAVRLQPLDHRMRLYPGIHRYQGSSDEPQSQEAREETQVRLKIPTVSKVISSNNGYDFSHD